MTGTKKRQGFFHDFSYCYVIFYVIAKIATKTSPHSWRVMNKFRFLICVEKQIKSAAGTKS